MDSSLHHAPPSMGLSRQEYWSGFAVSFSRESSLPRDRTQVSRIVDSLPSELTGKSISHKGSPWTLCTPLHVYQSRMSSQPGPRESGSCPNSAVYHFGSQLSCHVCKNGADDDVPLDLTSTETRECFKPSKCCACEIYCLHQSVGLPAALCWGDDHMKEKRRCFV